MTEKIIPYIDKNGDINPSAKMSEKFRHFIWDDEMSGTEDIISEINSNVAGDDIDTQVMLDADVGRDYFYACMGLAKNVIMSFEKEEEQ